MMTIPFERTLAVVRTRDLLIEIAFDEAASLDTLRHRAKALLKHYPNQADIDLSAKASPTIWARCDANWDES